MAVQQQAGRSPWDFADSIESAVNNAIDMHYKEKQMRIDEERYNDNKMMTMFQQEFKSYNDQFTQMTELLKMTDDPTMINEFLTGPEYRRLHSSMQSLIERQSEYFRSQGLPEEEVKEQTEPYQRKVAAKHKKMKIRLIGKGKGKHTAGSYKKKPSNKRSKSAPPAG